MKAPDTLEAIIKEGEGYLVEFKEAPSQLEKTFSAFANAGGGTLYLGITDQGKIKPVSLTNRLQSQIQSAARNCDPPVEISVQSFQAIIIIDISESVDKPVRAPDGFYLRIGSNSQKLSRQEILRFAVQETKIQFDRQLYVKEGADSLLSVRQVEKFRERARLEIELDNNQLLENIGCLQRQKQKVFLTYSGILLFGKNPQRIFPQATITLLYMKDTATILEQKIIQGTLLDQVENSFLFLTQILHKQPDIKTLRREDILEFPEPVLRELLVNAIIHRDYFETAADISIKVFPDYVEFSNPGIVGSILPLENLWGKSFRRNPILADIFFRANYIERAGTGLLRVRKILNDLRLPPLSLKEEGPFFIATLPRSKGTWFEQKLNSRQKEVLHWQGENFPISTADYARFFSISNRMARLDVKELVRKNILSPQREGRTVKYVKK